MSSLGYYLTPIIFEPVLTGAILLALLRGPPEVQQQFSTYLGKLPFQLAQETFLTGLKVVFGLGVLRRFSMFMDWLSFRNWELISSSKPWVWNEEVAVVTGGSGDIATSMIEVLLPKGVKIAILDVNPPRADIAANPNVKFYKCDLTSPNSVREVGTKIRADFKKNPTILVNNAGIAIGQPICEITDRQLETIFHVNIISHWYTVREFLPGMIEAKKGHILTLASMASYTGVAGIVDYCATKAACLAFHEGLTQEIRHLYNAPWVRTTCAHPFWTKTNLTTLIEDGIKKSDALVTPKYVGGILAKAILSGTGSHLVIPEYNPKMRLAPLLRGLPSWINSHGNDTTKDNILTTMNTKEGKEIAGKRYN